MLEVIKKGFEKAHVYALLKIIAVVLCIASMYYGMTNLTPTLSFTLGTGEIGIRVADSLRALALWSPVGAVGFATGATWVSLSNGTFAMGIYPLIPLTALGLGLLANKLSTMGEKSHYKNIIILAVYGIIMATLIAFNHALIKSGFGAIDFKVLFLTILTLKIPSGILSTIAGYPLYLAVNNFREKLNK